MTGQGKSQLVKKMIDKGNCFVFDVNNEYNLSTNVNASRARHVQLNEKLFIKQCSLKRNTVCVFEEATGFFEGRTSPEMRRLLIGKRHTNNIYVLLFHSISSVPPRIMQLANYVVLYKTGDTEKEAEKFPFLIPYYKRLLSMPVYSKFIIEKIKQ